MIKDNRNKIDFSKVKKAKLQKGHNGYSGKYRIMVSYGFMWRLLCVSHFPEEIFPIWDKDFEL